VILAAGIEPTLDLSGMSTIAVYLVVIGFIFIESGILVGFFLPGDSLLFGAGLLAASPKSSVELHILVIGVTVAAILGDGVGYWTGKTFGRSRLASKPRAAAKIAKAEEFYEKYGAAAVIIARWFPWIRTATPVVAGLAGMPYRKFLAANVIGALSWAAGLVLLGYYAYEIPWLRTTAILVGAVSIVAFVGVLVVRSLRRRSESRRDRREGPPRAGSADSLDR
jgi:membrane-associated protein